MFPNYIIRRKKMKKVLSIVGAGLVLAGALLVSSCGDAEGDNFYATSSIASPEVTLKAYPGANVLTWKAVKDAASYDVYVRVGDNAEEKLGTLTDTYYADTVEEALVAGASVKYNYRVVAKPNSFAAPLTSSEWSGSVSTKAVQAANGTKFSALSTADYENDYNANAAVLGADTIKVSSLVTDGYATISFPVKSYAKYNIYFNKVDGIENTSVETVEGALYKNNETATVKRYVTSSGKKTVTVEAVPYYEGYEAESFVANTVFEVPAAAEKTPTSDPSATYLTETTARISWKAAVLSNGSTAAAGNYRVYFKDNGSYTTVDATPKAGGKYYGGDDTYFYVDVTVADNTDANYYVIVLVDGSKYGTSMTATLSAYSYESAPTPKVSASSYINGTDSANDSIKVIVKKPSSGSVDHWYDSDGDGIEDRYGGTTTETFDWTGVTLELYKAQLGEDVSAYYAVTEWENVPLTNYDSEAGTYTVYLENLNAGNYIFKAVASKKGMKSAYAYNMATISSANVSYSAGNLYVTPSYDETTGKLTKNTLEYNGSLGTDVKGNPLDAIANYTFTVSKVVITTTYKASNTIETAVSTENLGTITPALVTGSTTYYSGKYEDTSVETRSASTGKTVKYYVTKTAKDGTSKRTDTANGYTKWSAE